MQENMQNIHSYAKYVKGILHHILHIFHIANLQYVKYAEYRPCTIILHIILHIAAYICIAICKMCNIICTPRNQYVTIVQGLYFAYWTYSCTPDFADDCRRMPMQKLEY